MERKAWKCLQVTSFAENAVQEVKMSLTKCIDPYTNFCNDVDGRSIGIMKNCVSGIWLGSSMISMFLKRKGPKHQAARESETVDDQLKSIRIKKDQKGLNFWAFQSKENK